MENMKPMMGGIRELGTSKEEQTQKMCETLHEELASWKQIASRDDGSAETQKARGFILGLTKLLDGESSVLDYLVEIRNKSREKPTE